MFKNIIEIPAKFDEMEWKVKLIKWRVDVEFNRDWMASS